MNLAILAGAGWLGCALVMLVLWLDQVRRRNATAVDVAWAANLGLLAVFYAAAGTGWPLRRVLLALVAGAWSLRLALHLLIDRIVRAGGAEDGRYADLRASWGGAADRNFFWFYQAQAALDALLSLPFLLASAHAAPSIHPLEIAGAALCAAGVAGETIADRQLVRHRADPARRDRTCREGLWSWSRHPNYFFEWITWCGFGLIALPSPHGWVGLLSPALMLLLIVKVTGIRPAEARALRTRGEDYRDYQRTTSAFVPLPPRRPADDGA